MGSNIKFALWIISLLLVVFVIGRFGSNTDNFLNPFINSQSKEAVKSPLAEIVNSVLADAEGDFGILIKNLKTGEDYTKNPNTRFEPASLYKVWVMGTVFSKIKEGEISENDPLPADVVVLNRKFGFSQEEAELKTGVLNFTIKSALDQMITISHNYAAMALIDKVGRDEIENFLKSYDLNESSMGKTADLVTTVSDLGKLFEKIYKGEIIDPEYSQKMIDVLLRQQRNDRIPKYLPEGVKIAHKTGELDNIRHDGGIVYCCKQELAHSPDGDYIIVVLTRTKSVTAASEKIAQISKAVYEYFYK